MKHRSRKASLGVKFPRCGFCGGPNKRPEAKFCKPECRDNAREAKRRGK